VALTDTTVCDASDLTSGFQAQYLETMRAMILARELEDRLAKLYRSGGRIVGGVYLGRGQEAFSAAAAIQLTQGKDIYGPLIRDQAGRTAFGEPVLDCMRTYLGTATGPMRGRDGNIHRGRPSEGYMAMISHLGSLVAVVAGALFSRRVRGDLNDAVGVTSIGDGGTSTGAFHEAMNVAAVEGLPLVVSVANNQFAYSTPTSRQFACEDLVERAVGYGVRGYSVDGTDLASCLKVFREAVSSARAGGGPQLIVGRLLRLVGHGEHDDASYIPDTVKHGKYGRDCIEAAEAFALQHGWIEKDSVSDWRKESRKEVDQAQAKAGSEPAPDPFKETWSALSSPGLSELYGA
jgi:pyruvate dehydrogenase E1 component alpha subunit/2-oxoisovalerate dehydrogenase E1 component alpha subunit